MDRPSLWQHWDSASDAPCGLPPTPTFTPTAARTPPTLPWPAGATPPQRTQTSLAGFVPRLKKASAPVHAHALEGVAPTQLKDVTSADVARTPAHEKAMQLLAAPPPAVKPKVHISSILAVSPNRDHHTSDTTTTARSLRRQQIAASPPHSSVTPASAPAALLPYVSPSAPPPPADGSAHRQVHAAAEDEAADLDGFTYALAPRAGADMQGWVAEELEVERAVEVGSEVGLEWEAEWRSGWQSSISGARCGTVYSPVRFWYCEQTQDTEVVQEPLWWKHELAPQRDVDACVAPDHLDLFPFSYALCSYAGYGCGATAAGGATWASRPTKRVRREEGEDTSIKLVHNLALPSLELTLSPSLLGSMGVGLGKGWVGFHAASSTSASTPTFSPFDPPSSPRRSSRSSTRASEGRLREGHGSLSAPRALARASMELPPVLVFDTLSSPLPLRYALQPSSPSIRPQPSSPSTCPPSLAVFDRVRGSEEV
ncbi:hypothetical protein MSAN_01684600 [Mycena sanguinolenta]|uniref:Uncharacterized protein n=1 Tax=Mycena sanguinolenta TaxID=230812 RepID=A0A8H6XWM6_9AGAR|nr:hypothetical protein MSAN_01684600 [Mycena sanguinolenta]